MKIIFFLIATIFLIVPASIFLLMERQRSILEQHIQVMFGKAVEQRVFVGRNTALVAAGKIGTYLFRTKMFSTSNREALRRSLQKAGINDTNALPIFLGSKILCGITGGFVVFFLASSVSTPRIYLLSGAGIGFMFGMLLPDMVIARKRSSYLTKLKTGIPDMLDMLVICAEAGLNLEASLERVGEEMQFAHPEVNRELMLTMNDVRVMSDRDRALLNMGTRTGLPALERLATTLVQALRFGTPVRQALRILAIELRNDSLTAYESKAAKLPVFLTIPMILFILPSLFIVIIGPAVLSLMHQFKG